MSNRRAIVTGGAGFIGSHVVDALLADQWGVVVVDDLSTGDAGRVADKATLEAVADRIEKRIQERGEAEVPCRVVGEEVMSELHQLDQVAYVRFASVYREFKDVAQFMDEVKGLLRERGEGQA